jgi:hypothetical protein
VRTGERRDTLEQVFVRACREVHGFRIAR